MAGNYRAYLLRKAFGLVLTVLFITILNFVIFQVLPGDPTRFLVPRGGGGPSDVIPPGIESLRRLLIHEWGLDRPVYERLGIYFWNLLHGNWGTSITLKPGTDVWTILLPRTVTTIVFIGTATLISIWLGVRLGRIAGSGRGGRADAIILNTSLFLYSVPTFWLAMALIFLLSVYAPILPTGGETSPFLETADFLSQIVDRGVHLLLPVAAFVLNNYAIFTLIMRNSLTEELSEDYMMTAKAKGLSSFQQLRRHAVPNARLPVATIVALYVGWVFSGAIVIEVVFRLNGLGALTYDAVVARDYPLLSALFLVGTMGVVVANTVLDIAYSYLDPRVTEA